MNSFFLVRLLILKFVKKKLNMSKKDTPISIRVSDEDGENADHDLFKAIYIHARLKSLGISRTSLFRNLKKMKLRRQYKDLSKRAKPIAENLSDITNEFNIQLQIWDQARNRQVPKLIHTVNNNHCLPSVNIVAPYFNEPNDFCLSELHLILDLERFQRKVSHQTQGNFWQCCEMSDFVGCEEWGQLPHYWESDVVDITKEPRFIAFFNFGFQIFLTRKGTAGSYTVFERIHKTRQPARAKYISLEYTGSDWPEDKTIIDLDDVFILRPNDYFQILCCPNDYCDYNTNRQFNLDRHIKTCSQDTVVNFKQRVLTENDIHDWCIEIGALPENFFQKEFATFDIESVGVEHNFAISEVSKLNSLQRVVSVSITSSFSIIENRTHIIVRNGMDEPSYRQFISDFVSHLRHLQKEYEKTLPKSLFEKLKGLQSDLDAFKNRERTYSFSQISRMREAILHLQKIRKLNVFGFNSSSYDLGVLFSGLLVFAKQNDLKFNVIKRGNHIMSLRLDEIVFADCLNFSPGCNLDSFGKMWNANCKKAVFPYEKYSDISQMAEDKYWPRMIEFKSSLSYKKYQYTSEEIMKVFEQAKTEIHTDEFMFTFMVTPDNSDPSLGELFRYTFPVCLMSYVDMWIYYTRCVNAGTMNSMLDYLKFYNSIDTELLTDAFKNYVDSFIKNFRLSPIGYVSLPGYAERVLWNMYSIDLDKPYSFSSKHGFVSKIIRENLMGGLSCVFKRHVEIDVLEENFSPAVHRAANGEKFTKLIAYDANSELCSLLILLYF